MKPLLRNGGIALLIVVVAVVFWLRTVPDVTDRERPPGGRIAVEAVAVETGSITDVRQLSGTIEAGEAFAVAPNISGRITRIHVDIGDRVERGELLVELDDEEALQAVAQAEAALAVARAERNQSISDAELAEREFERTRTLAGRDLASQSELDAAQARAAAERSAVAVAEARMRELEASLQATRVRLGYTRVRANWPATGGNHRVIGERLVSTGDTVAANTPLLSILSIEPVKAVVFAPERDYAALATGQAASVVADAMPERSLDGTVRRLAPRFEVASRQARVEVEVDNADRALKPGMFVTVTIDVGRADDVTLVPRAALTRRGGTDGVYLLDEGEDPPRARFVPVLIGIETDDRVEIRQPELRGRVVTLGQQLLEDGAPVIIAGTTR